MKLLFLSLAMLFSVGISAQYAPIVKTDSVSWTIKHEIWDRAKIESLYLTGSTTIDSKIYYPTYYTDNGRFEGLVGYFREDVSTGKAWFQGIEDTSEYLIMDLNLKVGDSILINFYDKDKYAHVTSVGIENNRKVVTTDYHMGGGFISENLKFIEGVGPNASLLYQLEQAAKLEINSLFGFLVCKVFNNNDLVYAWDPVNFECGPLWNDVKPGVEKKMLIYPNPSSEVLKIAGEENLDVFIFDRMGKLVLTTHKKEIDISHLIKGIYVVRVSREGKVETTQEIIKK